MSAAEQTEYPSDAGLPLAVDLDGTLVHGDAFFEGILRMLFASPLNLFVLVGWLMRGRAYAKARIAERYPIDPAILPYDARVVEWLRAERAKGRTIALATASDERVARAIADYVGLFDAVFASDGRTNLKSTRKAECLARAYPHGFVYAGNESADIKVWRAAAGAVTANCSPALHTNTTRMCAVERNFPREGNAFAAFMRAIRPQQWVKNLLVFLPMLVGQGWADVGAWLSALIAFGALSLSASAVYLVNDAADIDADRVHPRKRARPFASGAFSPAWGLAGALVLLAGGLALAALAQVVTLTLLYLGVTTAYTFVLKRVALVDVFTLAGLYTIRIILGGAATTYFASDWLLAFSCFFFLSLALVKRVAEARDLAARGANEFSRRGYQAGDADVLTMMGVSAGFIAALVLSLYLQDDTAAAHYTEPFLLWGLPAASVFWTCRVWLIASRGEMHDDPIVFAARDKWSWLVAALAAGCFAAAVMGPEIHIRG